VLRQSIILIYGGVSTECMIFIKGVSGEYITGNFFPYGANCPIVGQGLLIIEASQSHSGTPQSVGLLWTSDHAEADTST
jgi:hypothetical protein